jgi:hypothetical protein
MYAELVWDVGQKPQDFFTSHQSLSSEDSDAFRSRILRAT